jgi:hypothetical protein
VRVGVHHLFAYGDGFALWVYWSMVARIARMNLSDSLSRSSVV